MKEVYLNESGQPVRRGKPPGRPSNASRKQRDVLLKALRRSREVQLRKTYEPVLLIKTKELLTFTRSIGFTDSRLAVISGVRVSKIHAIRAGTYRGSKGTGDLERIIGAIQSFFAAIIAFAQEQHELLDERAMAPAKVRFDLKKAKVTFEVSGIPPTSLRPIMVGNIEYTVDELIDLRMNEIIETARKKGFDEINVQVFVNKESISGLPKEIAL